jgi:predicted metal-binding protein
LARPDSHATKENPVTDPIHPEIEQIIRAMFDAEGRERVTHDRAELVAAVRHLLVAVDVLREEEAKLRKEHRDAYLVAMEERDSARNQLRARAASSGECDGCGCCTHEGCHRFAGATCPTDSLGDSVCPCTED